MPSAAAAPAFKLERSLRSPLIDEAPACLSLSADASVWARPMTSWPWLSSSWTVTEPTVLKTGVSYEEVIITGEVFTETCGSGDKDLHLACSVFTTIVFLSVKLECYVQRES